MEQLFNYSLNIAELPFQICSDQPLSISDAFLPFLTAPESGAYTAAFRCTDTLPEHNSEILTQENCFRVYPDGHGGFLRGFFDIHNPSADYALESSPQERKHISIAYLASGSSLTASLANAIFHIGIEGVLIRERKICCHAALVRTAYGGILFSGPSGIGKSTQADLWCRLENSTLLNGDRPILGIKNDQWLGWGSPYAGSSRCYVNESCPISAIVMLSQAPVCSLQRLPLKQAYRKIYANLTVNLWNPDFCVAAFDLAVQLAASVPVYSLACTPDERSVSLLKKQLEKDLEHR